LPDLLSFRKPGKIDGITRMLFPVPRSKSTQQTSSGPLNFAGKGIGFDSRTRCGVLVPSRQTWQARAHHRYWAWLASLTNDCGEPGIKRGLTQLVFYELARHQWPPLRTVEPEAVAAPNPKIRLKQRMQP
jgi:hypothetical protein